MVSLPGADLTWLSGCLAGTLACHLARAPLGSVGTCGETMAGKASILVIPICSLLWGWWQVRSIAFHAKNSTWFFTCSPTPKATDFTLQRIGVGVPFPAWSSGTVWAWPSGWEGLKIQNVHLNTRWLWLWAQLYYLVVMWSWGSHFTSLSLIFFMCQIGITKISHLLIRLAAPGPLHLVNLTYTHGFN